MNVRWLCRSWFTKRFDSTEDKMYDWLSKIAVYHVTRTDVFDGLERVIFQKVSKVLVWIPISFFKARALGASKR